MNTALDSEEEEDVLSGRVSFVPVSHAIFSHVLFVYDRQGDPSYYAVENTPSESASRLNFRLVVCHSTDNESGPFRVSVAADASCSCLGFVKSGACKHSFSMWKFVNERASCVQSERGQL